MSPADPPQHDRLLKKLAQVPLAKYVLEVLAGGLIPPPPSRVRAGKEINDPIWKIIRTTPLEVCLLDTPLMQRLRGIRQLGLAHLVYPGATHTRLEHSLGVMHAAKRMFAALANSMTGELGDSDLTNAQVIVGIAGLLHDCGHVAFSHVGEHVLEDTLHSDFDDIRKIFAEELARPIKFHRADGTPISPEPHPAELLSALFVVSEPMVSLLNGQGGTGRPADELAVVVAGLILGYAGSLLFGKRYLHFLKDIISGDLDADKVDYVARDGYFAGVPLAVDVERLMSQLVAVDIRQNGLPASVQSQLPEREIEGIYVIGLRPTGASAMEMLVLTRVYLFDRIYLHHKVKAAERFTESVLRSYALWLVQCRVLLDVPEAARDPDRLRELMKQPLSDLGTIGSVLDMLMRPGGDDGLLAEISKLKGQDDLEVAKIGEAANDLLFRRLPARALPIALRASARTNLPRPDQVSQVLWPKLKLDLKSRANRDRFEDRVIGLCGDDAKLLFDYAQRKPVPEDPDIWVRTAPAASAERLSRHFSVEQLSNAYKELKETGWVFCEHGQEARVAASTAVALYEQFGIVPNAHGLDLAKVEVREYDAALAGFLEKGTAERNVVDALTAKVLPDYLVVQSFEVLSYLPGGWGRDEAGHVADKIARGITRVQLPIYSGKELRALLPILQLLLRHAHERHDDFHRWEQQQEPKEKFFAADLRDFLTLHEIERTYLPFKELPSQPGRIDLAFVHRESLDVQIVVELKSERTVFTRIVGQHAGQPMAYCTRGYARVSIFYAQFGGDAYRQSDAIEVRSLPPEVSDEPGTSKLAAICIGHRGFGEMPSRSGKHSIGV